MPALKKEAMTDILHFVQNRIERLHGEEREEAERIIQHALRQIDLIQQGKELREEIASLRSELQADRSQKRVLRDLRDDEWLTSAEVQKALGHERTYLWELGEVGLLKPFERKGNGNRYRVRDFRHFMEIDPVVVQRTLKEWRLKNKGKARDHVLAT